MKREVDQFGVDFRNVFNQTPLMIAAPVQPSLFEGSQAAGQDDPDPQR